MDKTNILLVEDSAADARLIQVILREFRPVRFDVCHVSYLREALEKIRTPEFSAVLLDLSLPDSQGFETFLKIREAARELPVLILTGNDDEEVAVNAVREGAQDYVVKGTLDSDLLGRAICYAIERKKSEERIRKALLEREVMLREIHHRVRNNLQVVCSLLSQQGRKIPDKSVRFIFDETRNRILSMAMVHEELYRSKDFSRIDFERYLQTMTRSLAHFYQVDRERIVIDCKLQDFFMQIDTAVPCGLIVNELVSNALKHGVPQAPERSPIRLEISLTSDGMIRLSVEDMGPGLPEPQLGSDRKSLGFEVISILLDQINGRLSYSREKSTKFLVEFPAQPSIRVEECNANPTV